MLLLNEPLLENGRESNCRNCSQLINSNGKKIADTTGRENIIQLLAIVLVNWLITETAKLFNIT